MAVLGILPQKMAIRRAYRHRFGPVTVDYLSAAGNDTGKGGQARPRHDGVGAAHACQR